MLLSQESGPKECGGGPACAPHPQIMYCVSINQCPCVPALRSTGSPEGDLQVSWHSLRAWHNPLSQGLWVLSPSSIWPGDFGHHCIPLTLPPKDEPYSLWLLRRWFYQLLVALGEQAARKVPGIAGFAKKGPFWVSSRIAEWLQVGAWRVEKLHWPASHLPLH